MYWQSFFKSFCLLRAEARKKRTVFIKKVQRQLHFLLVFSTRVEKLSLHLAFIYNIGVELPHLMASNPCALAEQPIENSSDNERSQHHYGEAPCPKLHAVDEVHTKQTGDKRGKHQDNADAGHLLHHARHIIVNNIGVSIHCRIKNV